MARHIIVFVLVLSATGFSSTRVKPPEFQDTPIKDNEEVMPDSRKLEGAEPCSGRSCSTDESNDIGDSSHSQCSKQTFYLDEDNLSAKIAIKTHNCPGRVVEREVKGIKGYHMLVVFSRFMADARHIQVDDGDSLLTMNKYGCSIGACPAVPIPISSDRVVIKAHPIMGDHAINVDIIAFVIATEPEIPSPGRNGVLNPILFTILLVVIGLLSLIVLMLCCCLMHSKSAEIKDRWTPEDELPNSNEMVDKKLLCSSVSLDQQKLAVNTKFDSEPLSRKADSQQTSRFLSSS